MAYVITPDCERDGLCVDVCPTDAIHFVEGDANWPTYYISPDLCIDCGACQAECPNDAIFSDFDLPSQYESAADKNQDFYVTGPGASMV